MGLAPLVTAQLFDTIRDSKAAGISMLLVEQYVDAALGLADYGSCWKKEESSIWASRLICEARRR